MYLVTPSFHPVLLSRTARKADFFCQNDQSSHRDSTQDVSLTKLELSDFPLKRLRLLAEYGGFEQNAYWHRRLAKMYRDAGYINAAIKEFSISIKMDDQDYAALEGMAFCYEKRKDYLSAIEWEYVALAALPKESRAEKARILQHISKWKSLLEDKDGAIEASRTAYSLSPQDIDTSIAYLSALENNSRFQAIIDFAANLETINSVSEGENMLTFLFVESWGRAHDIIGNAARRLGRIDSVDKAMRDALTAVERRKSSRGFASSELALQFSMLGWADFLEKYAYKIDEAIETYETALERSPSRTTSSNSWSLTITIKDRLSQLYYQKAKAAECAGTPFDRWVSKIEGLVKTSDAKDVGDIFASDDSSLVLGLWYRLHGREHEAKLCFRKQMLDGIDKLTDDDPGNDIFGYVTLALTLLKAGDRENAGAAFAVTTAYLERLKDSRRRAQKDSDEGKAPKKRTIEAPLPLTDAGTSSESSIEKSETKDPEESSRVTNDHADGNAIAIDDKFDLDLEEMTTQIKQSDDMFTTFNWGCDGNCNRRVEDWQELHFCEICTEYTCFCDECIKLVKTGILPFRKCDAGHTFYQGYPLSKEMQDVATIETEGKILPRTEWLEALRKEWVA